MPEFLLVAFKLGLVACLAPYWLPVIKAIVKLVDEASRQIGGDEESSPVVVTRTDDEGVFDDAEDSTWSKNRRTNQFWDTGR